MYNIPCSHSRIQGIARGRGRRPVCPNFFPIVFNHGENFVFLFVLPELELCLYIYYVIMCVCLSDCNHTFQHTTFKLWHIIPHVTIYKQFSQIFETLFFF